MDEDYGFTLLETLVALAVLIVTLTSLYQLYGNSLTRYRAASELTDALRVAQRALDALGTEHALADGSSEALTPDRQWRVRTTSEPAPGSTGVWVSVSVLPAGAPATAQALVTLQSFKLPPARP